MKNQKLLWTIIIIALAAAAFATVFLLARRPARNVEANTAPDEAHSFATLAEAAEYAGFRFSHTDRLNGAQVSGYVCGEHTITAQFGEYGAVSKALLVEGEPVPEAIPAGETDAAPLETSEQTVDGVTVRFLGTGAEITEARWTDNGYAYLIRIQGPGVGIDEMIRYVSATK